MLPVQVMGSLTKMSPLPLDGAFGAPDPEVVLARAAVAAAPVMSPPLSAMVKSRGSMSQRPWSRFGPGGDPASSRTVTVAAEVSMNPPSPPSGAEASRVPPTTTVPGPVGQEEDPAGPVSPGSWPR